MFEWSTVLYDILHAHNSQCSSTLDRWQKVVLEWRNARICSHKMCRHTRICQGLGPKHLDAFCLNSSWGQALKISDSSLKTSHPWAEASVVVCTGARALDKDCFSSQNLTCVCSDWMPILPLNLPACNAQTAFLYRMDTSISLGWFQPWPWTSLQKQRRRAEVFENRRGNNQHNHSTTVQLKGRDCTRWTGEKF